MAGETSKNREEIASQPVKTGRAKGRQQDEERRLQEALEDDEVREALKLSRARDKSG